MKIRYGADHPLRAAQSKAKRKQTVKKRFGADPLALPKNRQHLSEAGQKGYRALIRKMGDQALSKPEAQFAQMLRNCFGNDDVMQQVPVNHGGRRPWLIDFYVKSLDVYIEVDGIFWHGLDCAYEDLHSIKQKKYDADRRQDEWFLTNGKKLVRITDKELTAGLLDETSLVARLGG